MPVGRTCLKLTSENKGGVVLRVVRTSSGAVELLNAVVGRVPCGVVPAAQGFEGIGATHE